MPNAFLAGYDTYAGPKQRADYFTKKWLGLRLNALRRGMLLDERVSPAVLATMIGERCPVSLRRFDVGRKGSRDAASVDRVVNEGTYALGNLMMVSQRVNRAKGSLSFEMVAEIAQSGDSSGGLEPMEWMRLASLMYGAWNAQHGDRDPFLVPLATYPTRFLCTPLSQVIQWLLLRGILERRSTEVREFWATLTVRAVGSAKLFQELVVRLEDAACDAQYLPTVWLRPPAFDAFESWYLVCRTQVDAALMEMRGTQHPSGFDVSALVEGWQLGRRELRSRTDTVCVS